MLQEIFTLSQFIPNKFNDLELAQAINEGWQIVTLSHHSVTDNSDDNKGLLSIQRTQFIRIVTLIRQVPEPAPTEWKRDPRIEHIWTAKQRVQLMQDLSDDGLPLQAGDLGFVVKSMREGEPDGVLFDRYDSVSYTRKIGGKTVSILDFCQPYTDKE